MSKHGPVARHCLKVFVVHAALAARVAVGETKWPPCTGYHPGTDSWDNVHVAADHPLALCGPGEAVMLLRTTGGPRRAPDHVGLDGNCCPLPAASLTDKHLWRQVACPPDFVITGGRVSPEAREPIDNWVGPFEIRCTRIETGSYELGPERHAVKVEAFFDFGDLLRRLFQREPTPVIGWSDLPSNIRYGIARSSRTEFLTSGSLGSPWGSVLVRMGSDSSELRFRELRERGSSASIPSRCDGIADIFSTAPRCVGE